MYGKFQQHLQGQIDDISSAGLYKNERQILSAQNTNVSVSQGKVLNLCANNYLGLAQHPDILAAAHQGLDEWGYGLASVRFICGTQQIHKQLEQQLTDFLGTQDTILYPSCFDANGGLYETLLGPEDAVISDSLNHASIIDGIRLCKAKRYRYQNNDMQDLEQQLIAADAAGARFKLISTDGVFSMDGFIAQLDKICDLADKYNALVHFDDSHAVGFVGKTGRGTHEHCNCIDRIDITTGTLGKALGGASGGYTSGKKEIIELLRQRSRPYLFSNTVAPPVVAGGIAALNLLTDSTQLRDKVEANGKYFREGMQAIGYDLLPGNHPIIPIMLYDARKAAELAERMLTKGIYVTAFSFPVVPKEQARIRTQISAAHSIADLDFAIACFKEAKEEMGI
ncbi:MAG: 2-amino-3-ketobutyrate coenzyme A ligase [Osedax symbiont Rs2]|nr:MAG: 2-amino-3-ketobutyrate coenzyme A ligase [Osedax symbiont Rs2]